MLSTTMVMGFANQKDLRRRRPFVRKIVSFCICRRSARTRTHERARRSRSRGHRSSARESESRNDSETMVRRETASAQWENVQSPSFATGLMYSQTSQDNADTPSNLARTCLNHITMFILAAEISCSGRTIGDMLRSSDLHHIHSKMRFKHVQLRL